MLLDKTGVPSQAFWDIIDAPDRDQYTSLDAYCKAHQGDVPSSQLITLKQTLETKTLERLRYVSLFEFFAMQKSNQWGNAGEYQIRLSMMGHLLKIGTDETPSFKEQEQFTTLLDEYYTYLDIELVDEKDLHVLAKTFTLDFFGRAIPNAEVETFNTLLQFIGSKNSVYISNFDNARRFIYGEARTYSISNHKIYWFVNEICRSPHFIMAEAACSGDRDVMVRQTSLETVFMQKWVPVLEPGNDYYLKNADKSRVIFEAIKRKALTALGISTQEELRNKKDEFIKIMGETIIYHELGHVVVQNDILPKSIGPVAEGTKSLGYQIFLSLVELLADFAPSYNNLHGAIKQIYRVSKKSPQKATAMFYVYLSDVWFFDTQDEYMYLYSELVLFAMLRYINSDQTINFEKINYDIHFDKRKKEENKDANRFVNFLFVMLIRETRVLKKLLEKSVFKLQDQSHALQSLRLVIRTLFESNGTSLKPDDYDYLTSEYSYVFMVAEKGLYPEGTLQHQLKKSETKVRESLVKLYDKTSTGPITADKSREILFKKMTELGFTLN